MPAPNNRRIFDMAAHTWKQAKVILTGPLELPSGVLKLIDSLTFHGHSSASATFSTAVSVDGRQFVEVNPYLTGAERQRLMEQFIHAVQHGSEGGAMPGTICTQAPAAQPALTTERLRENFAAFERERMGLWDVGPFQLSSPEAPPRTPREYVAWHTPTPRTCVNPGVPFVIGSGHNDVEAWLQRHGVPRTAIAVIQRAGQLRGFCAPRVYLTGNHTQHAEWGEMQRALAVVRAEVIYSCSWCLRVHELEGVCCPEQERIIRAAARMSKIMPFDYERRLRDVGVTSPIIWPRVQFLDPPTGTEDSPPTAPAHALDFQALQLAGPPAPVHGHYLCEFCFDQMTDQVLPAAESPTGLAMAWCGCDRDGEADGR